MAQHIDTEEWSAAFARPDWYLTLFPRYQKLTVDLQTVEEIYTFVEQQLSAGTIALGADGPDWDRERKPVDTIVIHHTHCPPAITPLRLSAMHLLRLYAANYASPAPSDYHKQGNPIYSHHFRDGMQVFYAYHFIVRMDGSAERLLSDSEIGWQAGKWEINCRSVGIVLDNDLEAATPPDVVLDGLARLIRTQYPHVPHERIFGHREVNPRTTCPSEHFLGEWKGELLKRLV
jgi:hypothetical protein